MKSTLLTILLLIAIPTVGVCDGIPWDRTKGKMTGAHMVLRLSEEQMQEYRDTQGVTLTKKQHARLRRKSERFPIQIKAVVTYRYGDCSCCVGHPYAIMLPGEYEIAIPLSEISRIEEYGTSDPAQR